MLRDIESKLAGLVEGTFGRLFRSEVTPAELARGLAREMETTRRPGADRTWVAGQYDVFLSPGDHRRMVAEGDRLTQELSNGLLLHAREQRLALAHAPVVVLHREERLGSGRYGVRATHDPSSSAPVKTEPVRSAPVRSEPPVAAPRSEPSRPREAVVRAAAAEPATGLVLVREGRRESVPVRGGTIGRSRDCDLVIASAEVSREHAEIRPSADGWVIFDLGSTNGVRVNGAAVGGPPDPAPLSPGDRVELGTVVLQVEAAS